MTAWSDSKTHLEQLRDLQEVQGREGNWNHDSYMCGLFNGLEMALALYEDRTPQLHTLRITPSMYEDREPQYRTLSTDDNW